MKVKFISLPYIFQVLYVLCFTRPKYQVSVYRTIGPLVMLAFSWKNLPSEFAKTREMDWFHYYAGFPTCLLKCGKKLMNYLNLLSVPKQLFTEFFIFAKMQKREVFYLNSEHKECVKDATKLCRQNPSGIEKHISFWINMKYVLPTKHCIRHFG